MKRHSFAQAFVPAGFAFLLSLGLLSACDQAEKTKTDKKAQQQKAAAGDKAAKKAAKEKPSAKKAREMATALPPADKVQAAINPSKLEPYTGPTGSVRGIVYAKGDAAPELPEIVAKMDGNCTTSRATFGHLFREGKNRELADVLVAVTNYEGFVPAKGIDVSVQADGCAWDRRTVALTYGQRVKIRGVDNRPYVPEILGQPMPAQLFVLPTSPEVNLTPQKMGRFKLVDSMRLFNVAELFVLPYSTVDISDTDGAFEIEGIPVGEVKVNAFLPQTGAVVEQTVKIEAGKTVELKFELPFDGAAWEKSEKPVPLDEVPGPDDLR